MKTLLNASLFVLCVLTFNTIQAQTVQEEIDLYQSVFGMEKKVMIAEFMGDQADDSFWELYDAYELARKELGKRRLGLLEKYANNYVDMSPDVADILIKDMQAQKKSLDKLIDSYQKKIRKNSGSIAAAQFYQFENYLLAAIRVKIMESIPLIGEFDANY